MRVLLRTERLTLRQFVVSDVEALVDLDADPEVMRFITGGRPTSRALIESRLLPMYLAQYLAGDEYGRWAAVENWTGAFLGFFHLRPAPGQPPDAPELGYRLRRSAWGQGLATEGSRAVIDRGFTELGAQRVTAQTMAVNLASRRVLEKLGMAPTRMVRMDWPEHVDGREQGDIEYALTRRTWRRARRSAVPNR